MKIKQYPIYIVWLITLSSLLQPSYAIQIEFDYRFDTQGFFTDLVTGDPIQERRARLKQAASFYSGFTDKLTAIQPLSGNSWSVNIGHPGLLGSSVTLTNVPVADNSLRVFVGGSTSFAGVLGFAGTGWELSSTGSQSFNNNVITRGQKNTTGKNASDYATWGGSIWFNSRHNWYFGEDISELSVEQPDFLTTATHELGHILGYGEADSWASAISNNYFTGSESTLLAGGLVAIDQYGAHWGEGISSHRNGLLQEAMMDPSTPFGERQLPTELDYAGFKDIGWEVTSVPLPTGLLLFITGLLSVIGRINHKTEIII